MTSRPSPSASWTSSRVVPSSNSLAIGAPRLRGLVDVPDDLPDEPNLRLYRLLGRDGTSDPYSAYNAWIRTLVSFERAAEARQWRRWRAGDAAELDFAGTVRKSE